MGHKTKILDTVRGRVRVRDAVAGLLRRQTNKRQKKKKQSQKREKEEDEGKAQKMTEHILDLSLNYLQLVFEAAADEDDKSKNRRNRQGRTDSGTGKPFACI